MKSTWPALGIVIVLCNEGLDALHGLDCADDEPKIVLHIYRYFHLGPLGILEAHAEHMDQAFV